MKEQDIDRFLNKIVRVKWFDNDEKTGKLCKIVNGKSKGPMVDYHSISNGYCLYTANGGYAFRKSHIKKISIAL